MNQFDRLVIDATPSASSAPETWSRHLARNAGRVLAFALLLFAVALPHTIAGAHVALNLALLGWIVRDLAARRLRFTRLPLDLPLAAFVLLTVLSTIFSIEPQLSRPKLLSLLLFGVVYLCATNLTTRGVRVFVGALIVSALVGVGFSFGEKILGRGVTVAAITRVGPLGASALQPGDVIWMIDRHRVASLEDIAGVVRRTPAGKRVEVEALHEGDPLPIVFTVTDEMKTVANPLGIAVGGRSRRFRISGFTRHFITYADQMQIFALLSFGFLLGSFGHRRRLWLWGILSAVFAGALMLTAARAALAAYLLALVLTAALSAGRRAAIGVLGAAVLLGVMAVPILLATRTATTARMIDDSAARRFGYMNAGLRLIPRHPLLGVGMESHKLHWKEWGFPGEYVTHTHSTPIQLAMERGLPALACWGWLLATMMLIAWKAGQSARDGFDAGLGLGTFAALLGFGFGSIVNYNFGDAEVLLLLLALLGCVCRERRDRGRCGNEGAEFTE